MQVYESIFSAALNGPTFLTIGNFDGIHRGHRALIAAMREEAHRAGAACGLLTFHPHPRSVLRPAQPVPSLTSLHERLALYPETGLDFTVVHPFTHDTAQTEAEDFLRLLQGHLGVEKLWVGPDFALGRGRKGTVEFLREHAAETGISVTVFPEYRWEGQIIRSSQIRRLVELGNVDWANVALARFYSIPGVVVHGLERGRTLGFPTVNLSPAQGRVVPANGVYATWAWVEGRRFPSVTNIGVRPTVNGTHRTVEAHIIDFDENVYGRCVTLEFVSRLRDEVKFPGIEALKAQIARDRDRAAALLAANPQIPTEPRFEELAYTADWGVRVRGASQTDLYANAALAMFSLQGAADIDGPTVRQRIVVEGADREDLLVRWLSELLWQSEAQGALFQQFQIEAISDTQLQAVAVGRAGRSDLSQIKAITYHDLTVTAPGSPTDDWKAVLLFDI